MTMNATYTQYLARMGLESAGWVLLYIAAFGMSDTAVALIAPNSPLLFVYYMAVGFIGVYCIRRSARAQQSTNGPDTCHSV